MLNTSHLRTGRPGRAARPTLRPRNRALSNELITPETIRQAVVVLVEQGRAEARAWLLSVGLAGPVADLLLSYLALSR